MTNCVAVHWIEHAHGGAQPGLRSGSTALVTTKVGTLRNAGIVLYRGSENVFLTGAVAPEYLCWRFSPGTMMEPTVVKTQCTMARP